MKIRDYVRLHPLGAYVCSAFAISWIGCILAIGSSFYRGEPLVLEDLLVAGVLVLTGPFVAGLAMTYVVNGRPGLRDLAGRILRWQVGGRWYAALLIFPALLLSVSLLLSTWVSPEFSPVFFTPGIMMGLSAGFIEEIGWMGLAYPIMRSKRSILRASLYLGIVHALWHILPSFLGSSHAFGSYWLPYFTGSFVFIVALRLLIVWVYENTGSLLLAQLMHASSTGFFAVLIPTDIAPANWVVFYWVYAVVLSAAAVLIVARYGRNLKRQPQLAKAV